MGFVSSSKREVESETVRGNPARNTTTPQEVSGLEFLSKSSFMGPSSQPWRDRTGRPSAPRVNECDDAAQQRREKREGLKAGRRRADTSGTGEPGGATRPRQLQGSHRRTYRAEKRREPTDVKLSEKTRFI